MKNDDEDAEDLLELVEAELRQRRFARAVRLEHGANPNPWIIQFLKQELGLTAEDVYESPGELDYGDLRPISDLSLPKLRFEPWTPVIPPALADDDADIFGIIRGGDLLVHHPYESFNASVERFIKAAAEDPKVLAIKMTVYRTGDDSPFIHTLIRAAEARKQVVCLVELKARFDEERNIVLAQALENAGVHVVYGIVGLKTHTKLALVVRQDADGIRCYCHVGTGNYNAQTAKLYTDLGLFTCEPTITEEVVELFHYLTGRSLKGDYKKLLVAPVNMKDRFLRDDRARSGAPPGRAAGADCREDEQPGRQRHLPRFVRGFARGAADRPDRARLLRLRPGVPGMSENIRVISVIGRFLEHSRIFYFRNGADDAIDGEFYIGSADWMYRNLLARVEAVVPIEQRNLRERLWMILQTMQHDRRQAWDMRPDGSYVQREAAEGELGTHGILMALHREPTAAAAISQGR